jgi:polyphosphate glucokinase
MNWSSRAQRVLEILHSLLQPDKISIGGGNSRNITFKLDSHVQLISNKDGVLGGFMAWEMSLGNPKKSDTGNGGAMP